MNNNSKNNNKKRRSIVAAIPASFNQVDKTAARKGIQSFMSLMEYTIKDNNKKGDTKLEINEDTFKLSWIPCKNETINRFTAGMLMELELFEAMPNRIDLVAEIQKTTIVN